MDKLLWVAMSGAKENFHSLAVRSNNLANANTTGFKADFENSRAMSVFADAYPSRAFAMDERPGYNMSGGAIETTDRDLDIAVQGDGFIAVNDRDGMGSLMVGADGVLRTQNGLDVLDEDGTQIILPPMLEAVHISDDGVISGRPQGAATNVLENYQRIKLVNPESYKDIEKGYDGLFRLRDGTSLAQDQTVKVRSGMLEGSNVNPVEELTSLIRIQRQYDTTVKLIDEAGQMDQAQDRLLSYQ